MAIDLATGTMNLEVIDLALYGVVSFELKRIYSTASRGPAGVLGPGWRWTFDFALRRTLDGYVYTTAAGDEIPFLDTPDAFSERLRNLGAFLELRRISETEVVIIGYGEDRLANELVFRKVGATAFRLEAMRNTSGARVDLRYDDLGRLAAAHQRREQRIVRFAYDAKGRLARVDVSRNGLALGVAYHYTYDSLGRLVQVADHDGPLCQYSYDSAGRVSSESRRSGTIYQFAYDGDNRCVHVVGGGGTNERHLSYDTNKRVTRELDSHGELWLHSYNERGQVTETVSPTGTTEITQFDDEGRVVRRVEPEGFALRQEYDDVGRRTAVVYPRGLAERFEFDDEHNVSALEDFRGRRTVIERDARGLVTAMVLPDGCRLEREYDQWGDLVLRRDPGGEETRFLYDQYGKITEKVDQRGHIWSFTYNELGLLTQARDPLGGETQLEYDSQQRIIKRRAPDGTTSEFSYDLGDTYLVEKRSDGAQRYIRYSSCRQPLEVCDFSGNVSRFEWDTEQSRMTSMTTPTGARHSFRHNGDGDLIEHTLPGGGVKRYEWVGRQLVASIDEAGNRVEREYDDLGYLTKLHSDDGDIEYQFDPKHCAVAKLVSPDAVVEFDRDEFGYVSATRSQGVEQIETWDGRGRSAGFTTSLGDQAKFAYDPRGFLASADFGFCAARFQYDACGREVRRELSGAGALEMQYDEVGRLLRLAFNPGLAASGARVGSAMPAKGFTRSYDWIAGGRLGRIIDSQRGWRRFIHDPTRRLLAVDDSGGETQFFGYDGEGNRRFEANVADGHQLMDLPYRPGGPQSWSEVPTAALRRGGHESLYYYDDAGRVVEVRGTTRHLEYEYDAAGNTIAKHVVVPGRRDTWRFRWNAFGRMVALQNPKGEEWQYRYDGMGRRVQKIDPQGKTTRYVWRGSHVLYEVVDDQAMFFGHHPQTLELLAVGGSQKAHVVCDHIGAPSELIDQEGNVRSILTRDSWGRRFDDDPLPHSFPGQWRDPESGLSYNYFRYYDPDIGRYLSPDPIGMRGGFNVYGYVPSPEQFIDPLGDIARRSADNIVVPHEDVTQSRTQVNNPQGGPYMGGHDTVNGERVDLGSATVTDVADGDKGVVAHAYNGAPEGDLSKPRQTALNSGAAETTWWHSEQNAMTAVLRGHQKPKGNPPTLRLSGDGPIEFRISRPPCSKHRGHGCSSAVLHGINGNPSLAQQIANRTRREVIVSWPDGTEAPGEKYKKSMTFTPC